MIPDVQAQDRAVGRDMLNKEPQQMQHQQSQ